MKTIVLFLALLFFNSCKIYMDKIDALALNNNSGNQIYFHVGIDNSLLIYPITSLPIDKTDMTFPKLTTNTFIGTSIEWRDRIKELPLDTLSIYFFHPDTLSTYSWDKIRDNYNILKRYDLSVEDLELLDYEIVYPPTPEMADIQQYPPYEE